MRARHELFDYHLSDGLRLCAFYAPGIAFTDDHVLYYGRGLLDTALQHEGTDATGPTWLENPTTARGPALPGSAHERARVRESSTLPDHVLAFRDFFAG